MRSCRCFVAIVCLALGAAGCRGSGKWEWGEFESSRQLTINVKIGQDSNDNSPLAMSVVLVYDKDLQKTVAAMDAKQWMQARKQFLKDHGEYRHEALFEFAPGMTVKPIVRTVREGAAKGFIFVSYKAVGVWRYEFDPDKQVRVNFGKETMTVAQD